LGGGEVRLQKLAKYCIKQRENTVIGGGANARSGSTSVPYLEVILDPDVNSDRGLINLIAH